MLAVQRPRMGSSQPNNGSRLPFGYLSEDPISESSIYDLFPDPPPDPAPGNPILTTAEENGLANILAGIVSNGGYGEHNFGEGITGDEWMMPPSLMGTATSFGLQPSISLPDNLLFFHQTPSPHSFPVTDPLLASAPSAPTTHNAYANVGALPSSSSPATAATPVHGLSLTTASPMRQQHIDQSQPSEDVLAAANVLHNGSHGRSSSVKHDSLYSNGSHRKSAMGPPFGHVRHQQWSEFKQDGGRRMSQSSHAAEQEATWSLWTYGPEAQSGQKPSTSRTPLDLQYGTDRSFNHSSQHFVAPNEKENTEALHSDYLRYFGALELSNGVNTSRPPSPAFNPDSLTLNLKTRVPPSLHLDANGDGGQKWLKSNRDDEDEDIEQPQFTCAKTSIRKRKLKHDSASSPSGADVTSSGKRRKSAAAIKRENLTEDQKRENHINSEKKRRKVIQVGFENLGVIVPAIKGGNPSKSAMLEAAVAWLQDLLQGNETLQSQLSQL